MKSIDPQKDNEDWEAIENATNTVEAKIADISKLSAIEYEKQRPKLAQELGIRTSVLDKEVKSKRQELTTSDTDIFEEIEPWPVPVDGATLLNELADSSKEFLTLPKYGAELLALWVTFTYTIPAAYYAPILAITAPEKRCGKTSVLQWLSLLVCKPLAASNMTSASVFRSIQKWEPTLLIDEADTFLGTNEELRGVINSGHSRPQAYVIRVQGDDHEPVRFTTWCAKAISMIGKLPDTLADRSIELCMRRKLPHETVKKFRDVEGGHFEKLRRKVLRFALDNMESIKIARPPLPATLNDRAADNWSSLFAIAQVSGDEWFQTAQKASVALSGEVDHTSVTQELLQDIKTVFEHKKVDRIKSTDLIEALCEDEEAPWQTWNRGKPITGRQLSKKLSEFKISSSKTIRFGGQTAKGYEIDQFQDAFTRYLPNTANLSVTRSHPTEDAGFIKTPISNTSTSVTETKFLKPTDDMACDRVTDKCSDSTECCESDTEEFDL